MADGRIIGVLSPFVGGTYYGTLVAGVSDAAARRGGRTIAVQTLDAAADVTVNGGNPAFNEPAAWHHAAGFVVLADAVTPQYIDRLTAAGKPVVLVGHAMPETRCPTVLADNASGIRDIVSHLIGHGRRRIAFTGFLGATDVAERYHAYRRTLAAHGTEPDPALLLPATDNLDSGITWTAEDWLRLDADAVAAATDRNAIGVQRVLATVGVQCPRDYALTGFDNIDVAAYLRPELASAVQPLAAMGETAVELLLRAVDGEPVAVGPHRLPTVFVPRSSCGCTDFATALPPATTPSGRARLIERFTAAIPPLGVRDTDATVVAERAVDAVTEAAGGDAAVGFAAAADAVHDLYALNAAPEQVRLIARAIQEYARDLPDLDASATGRVAAVVQELMMVLGRANGRGLHADRSHLRSLISTQYTLHIALLYDRDSDPRDPAWLAGTPAVAATIALRGPDGDLTCTPGWRRRPGPAIPAGPITVEAFPPAELIAAAAPGETVFLVPARIKNSDRGWLAVVDTVECNVQDGREPANQCAALLTVALDLREQEEQLRRTAMSDLLTGLPNRASFTAALDAAIVAAAAGGPPFTVLFLDLDGFKRVNDTLGHAAGDQLLVRVAQRIRGCLRAEDVTARFGGDEFLVLLPGFSSGRDLDDIVARLKAAVGAPFSLDRGTVQVGVSIGTADSGRRHTAELLLHDADEAMYRAKAAGVAVA